jgi:putative sigma-54 modulation protein
MQVLVTGHHVEITDSMRSYVEKKMERIVRHFDHVIDVHCILTVEKMEHRAEAVLKVRGKDIHAFAVDGNMYASIDALSDKLDRLVKKRKDQIKDHHAAEGRSARH